ncbi:hypothetical protein ACFQGT_09965 [Natrialbaceae archaeon GCM10025810]|uniref:hypothetical protein n=1 Tax=Halovalidus salilacus TaxID=3075124 RepID=UPI00361C209C
MAAPRSARPIDGEFGVPARGRRRTAAGNLVAYETPIALADVAVDALQVVNGGMHRGGSAETVNSSVLLHSAVPKLGDGDHLRCTLAGDPIEWESAFERLEGLGSRSEGD